MPVVCLWYKVRNICKHKIGRCGFFPVPLFSYRCENCGRITAMSEEKQGVCLDREVCKDIEEVLTIVIANREHVGDIIVKEVELEGGKCEKMSFVYKVRNKGEISATFLSADRAITGLSILEAETREAHEYDNITDRFCFLTAIKAGGYEVKDVMIPVSPRFWWGIRNKSEDALRVIEALKEKHEEMIFFS